MSKAEKELPPPSMGRVILNLLPLIIVTWYLCQSRPDKQPGYQLEQCGKNLHTIGVAIETDRLLNDEKLYNPELKLVFGQKPVPACPVGGEDSYLEGYKVASDKRSYVLVCKGAHHTDASVPSDYPRIAFSIDEADGKAPAASATPVVEPTPAATATPAVLETPVVEPAKLEETTDVAKDQQVEKEAESEEEASGEQKEEPSAVEESPSPGATAQPE